MDSRFLFSLLLTILFLNTAQAEPLYNAIDPATLKPNYDKSGQSQPTLTGKNLRTHARVYKSETLEATVNPRNEMEFMTTIDEGEVLLYTWEASVPLYYDFHGHQHGGDPDVWTRYADGTSIKDQGSVVIPYTGEHGWYWVNEGTEPVTIKLTVIGYYNTFYKVDLSAPAQ